jgi:hypothetical protein
MIPCEFWLSVISEPARRRRKRQRMRWPGFIGNSPFDFGVTLVTTSTVPAWRARRTQGGRPIGTPCMIRWESRSTPPSVTTIGASLTAPPQSCSTPLRARVGACRSLLHLYGRGGAILCTRYKRNIRSTAALAQRGTRKSSAKWKVVYGHHPIYSYGANGDIAANIQSCSDTSGEGRRLSCGPRSRHAAFESRGRRSLLCFRWWGSRTSRA